MHNDDVTIKLSPQKLAALFRLGVLCASEINCTDMRGRDLVHQLCLQACAHAQSCGRCQVLCHKTELNVWPVSKVAISDIKTLDSKFTQ